MNFKLRIKNKATLTALIMAIIAFAYQIAGLIGYVPAIGESDAVNMAGLLINILVAVGIVTDPSTKGIRDSETVMAYDKPR